MVVEYETSGMSRVEFCQKHGLALSTLARYLRRREQGQDGGAGPMVGGIDLAATRRLGWYWKTSFSEVKIA